MIRYFRATAAVYASLCEMLDIAYGYPRPETHTTRTLPPVESLPVDDAGRVYLAISAEMCDYHLPAQLLPSLLFSGQVEEVTAAEYAALLPEAGNE